MKIGMLSGLWFVADKATIFTALQRVAALGFRYVDLHGVFHAGPVNLTTQDRLAVKLELAKLGLIPRNYVLHAPKNLASASQDELEYCHSYLKEGIDLAVDWGVNQLLLNAGQWTVGISRDQAWVKAVHFLQKVCDYAAPRGIFMALEAEPYVWFLVNDIPSTLRMVADVDRGNFTVLVDIGHMALTRESPAELEKLAGTIIHAHFSDHQPYQHTNQVIGTGFTPTGEYLDMLRRMDIDRQVKRFGYDELVISFELGVLGDQIGDPDAWVRRSLQHVLEIAPYLTLF